MKRIGLVCMGDPNDRTQWSGTLYQILKALRSRYETDIFSFGPSLWMRAAGKLTGSLKGKRHSVLYASDAAARMQGQKLTRRVSGKKYAFLFAVAAENIMAYYSGGTPYILLNDAVFADMVGYYWHDFDYSTIRNGKRHDKRAILRARAVISSNHWAKEGAVSRYGANPEKIHVVPFGANIPIPTIFREKELGETVRILFVGADWQRKGGDIALQTLRALRKLRPEKRFVLHLVGSCPRNIRSEEGVVYHGFLDKTDRFSLATLRELYASADVFLLPSRAECSAIVLCEAAGYGLPVFCYDTGGLSDYVRNGENGRRLPLGSNGADFARNILELTENPPRYREFSGNARRLYLEKLSWQAWLQSVSEILG